MQHHTTKKWYKTAIIIEIRHNGRANAVKGNLGQIYIRGRHFLRMDDRCQPEHACRQIKLCALSPFSNTENSLSECSPSDFNHSSTKIVQSISNMQSPSSSDPSSPSYRPQSATHPQRRRSFTVNPVPTLVCGVPIDVVVVPHHYNHVPWRPFVAGPQTTHEGGAPQQPHQQQARRHRHRSPAHLGIIGRRTGSTR